MNKHKIWQILILLLIMVSYTHAAERFSIGIGWGYGDFKMKEFKGLTLFDSYPDISFAPGSGISILSELSYHLSKQQSLGLGFTFLYGKNGDSYIYPEFDVERYDLSGDPGGLFADYQSGSNAYFFFPNVMFTHKIYNNYLSPYLKFGAGYGFGFLNISDDGKSFYKGSGPGFYTCLGSSFNMNETSSTNFEIGYRFFRTGEIDNDPEDYYSYNYFTTIPLDFSGVFVQSSFSFGL